MITVLNRAELFVDVNQEAAAKVWSVLEENGIEPIDWQIENIT